MKTGIPSRAHVAAWTAAPTVGLILLVGALLVGASGCATQELKRSALVPPVAPPIMTGFPIDNGRVRLSFGNATYLREAKPREKPNTDTNSGLYIPRTNFGGQVLVRIGRYFALGAKAELGLGSGADAIAPDLAPQPSGNVFGMGPAGQVWVPLGHGLELHFHGEALLFGSPYDEYVREISPVVTPWRLNRSGVDMVWVFSFAGALSYRWGPLAFFAGLSARNQPTNVELQETSAVGSVLSFTQDEVTSGPVYGVAFGGISMRFARLLEATLQIYQPLSDNPVVYRGPALALWLSVALGDPPRPPRRRILVPGPPARPSPQSAPPTSAPPGPPSHVPEVLPPPPSEQPS